MKNIIITGSANGVGKAVANLLSENNLILIDENKQNLEKISDSQNAKYYLCDLSDDEKIEKLI